MALYRKYRPRTFAEVIGQDHVTQPLQQALRTGRLNHAYLFSGPRGCGKTSSARILARSLNCEQGPTPDPCGECESCRSLAVDGAGSIDVIEIDAASHGGVDDARELRERAFFTPVAGRFKIYVIDEAHMVSSAGFNALLKLVEEPPEYVKFVFATTEPDKVLPTIRSRTHHYPFRLVPPGELRKHLETLCQAEAVQVEPAVFPLVVRAGGGSVRDTLSVLDQLIAGAGPEGVTHTRAVELLGVTDAALLDDFCDALVASDGADAFATVDRVVEAGHDPRRFAADLLERFRDLIVLQRVPDAVEKGLLDAPADQLGKMSTHASQLGPATLSRCADIVHNGLVEMRGTTSPRLLLELICARMLLPGADDSTTALLQRVETMERRFSAAPPPPPSPAVAPSPAPAVAPASAPPVAPAQSSAESPVQSHPEPVHSAPPLPEPPAESSVPEPPAESSIPEAPAVPAAPVADSGAGVPGAGAGALDAAALRRYWDEVVTKVGQRSKRDAAVAREASVRDVIGNTIVLHFQHAVHANMLAGSPQTVRDALQQVVGGSWQLRCESGDLPSSESGGVTAGAAEASGGSSAPPGSAAPAAAAGPYGAAGSPAPAGGGSGPAGSSADWPEIARPGAAGAGEPGPGATQPTAAAGSAAGLVAVTGSGTGQAGFPGSAPGEGPAATSPAPAPMPGPEHSRPTQSGPGPSGFGAPGPGPSRPGMVTTVSEPAAAAPDRSSSGAGTATTATAVQAAPARPSDEGVDLDRDERTAPGSGEQQALRLLQEVLGAEKIGDVAP